jgi:hypothetical protein
MDLSAYHLSSYDRSIMVSPRASFDDNPSVSTASPPSLKHIMNNEATDMINVSSLVNGSLRNIDLHPFYMATRSRSSSNSLGSLTWFSPDEQFLNLSAAASFTMCRNGKTSLLFN